MEIPSPQPNLHLNLNPNPNPEATERYAQFVALHKKLELEKLGEW